MTDWGASGRTDYYRATLVDPFTLADVGDLDIVPASTSLTFGYYTDNAYSGSVEVVGRFSGACDYLVRLWQRTAVDGHDAERALATMFVDSSPRSMIYGKETTKLSCYSTLYRFTQDVCTSAYTAKAGERVQDLIRKLIQSRGGVCIIDGDLGDKALVKSHSYDIGTPLSNILNDMCGWISATLGCDEMGRITVTPYAEPRKRPATFTFDAGNSLYVPGIDVSDNKGEVCNISVAYYSSSKKTIRKVAELPESDRYSFANIGRYIPIVTKLTDDSYATDAKVQAEADRVLAENRGLVRNYEIEHVGIPDLRPGDVVNYLNDSDGIEPVQVTAMVVEMDFSLTPGQKTKTKLKEVTG